MLFSIISVCFKNPEDLELTLQSIIKQKCQDYQLIVIDGGSGELISQVIDKYKEYVSVFVSEPDNGVYDAMNKGAKEALGEYVIYMNSGDQFYDRDTLATVKKALVKQNNIAAVYGDTITDYGYKKLLCKSGEPSSFLDETFYSLSLSHQSIFVRRDLLTESPFDLSFKVAADFSFLYTILRQYNASLIRIDKPVSIFATGGLSDIDKTILNNEIKKVYFKNNSFNLRAHCYFLKLISLEKLKKYLRPVFRKYKL